MPPQSRCHVPRRGRRKPSVVNPNRQKQPPLTCNCYKIRRNGPPRTIGHIPSFQWPRLAPNPSLARSSLDLTTRVQAAKLNQTKNHVQTCYSSPAFGSDLTRSNPCPGVARMIALLEQAKAVGAALSTLFGLTLTTFWRRYIPDEARSTPRLKPFCPLRAPSHCSNQRGHDCIDLCLWSGPIDFRITT